jgi:demethylmenaquinone methyltransferase / 2-methoxy-6-polyprenyl-1,4-benzoquinol methylase
MRSVEESRTQPNRFARELFEGLPSRYDVLAEVLSFGQNHRWHSALVEAVVRRSRGRLERILDVATGTGLVAQQLRCRSSAEVVGVDLTEEMLRRARVRMPDAGLLVSRAEQLPFPDATFDALTFTYLLRYVRDPAATVRELARVVRPGGVVAALDFGVPPALGWRVAWTAYTRIALPAAGAVAGGREWWEVGRFLGPSISAHERRYPPDWTVEAWQRAGLTQVKVRRMSLGGGVVMSGLRRG